MEPAVFTATAAALTIGAHLHTFHIGRDSAPPSLRVNDSTPGLYLRTESGLTAGIARNSLRRTSVYLAQTWSTDDGRWSLSAGVITGYKNRKVYGQHVCAAGREHRPDLDAPCSYRHGKTNAHLRPLIAPSVALSAIGGVTPRVVLLGKGINVSVEMPL